MGIREDARELLQFIYDLYTNDTTSIQPVTIIEAFHDWSAGRINRAIDYLRDLNALRINLFLGNISGVYNFEISGLTATGIQIVEDNKINKEYFG